MMNGYEYTGMDAILAGSFRAAIYCRLSKDDDLDGESASIANQRDMLESYCEKQGWEVVAVYQDDGYTGLNMERPDLKRMLKAIERRQINLVITKDLSRLGRNYLQTGTLIEDFFPRHGVRYIAMNDGIDTMRDNNDIAPFKNILNEMYSKDISKKVHSSYLLKAQQGQFTGCVAPFGYRKDPEDKNHLLVDEETAPIVRQIFLWALEGHGPNFIRRRLEEQKVPCPTWWNRERGFRNVRTKWDKKDPKNGRYMWDFSVIKDILMNPVYTGAIASQKKDYRFKIGTIGEKKPQDWIVVAGLDDEIYERFRDGGVAHVIAISGLHIAIISEIIFVLLKRFSKYLALIISMVFIWFYGLLVGMTPSVIRAIIMFYTWCLSIMLGRDYDLMSSASLACIILIIKNPFYLYNISFLYSFSCVFGIALVQDIITKYSLSSKKLGNIFSMMLVSLSANIFAKPITMKYFYHINLWDFISNILIVPFMGILVCFSIISNLIAFISVEFAKIIILIPNILINIYLYICDIVTHIPLYRIETGGISIVLLVSIYYLLINIYKLIYNIENIKFSILPLAFIITALYFEPSPLVENIYAGDGLCQIIDNENGSCTIYNCGSKYPSNHGQYRILNYIKYHNFKYIDKVYIKEMKYGNMGGILEICDDIKINKIIIPKNLTKNKYYRNLLAIANESNIEILYGN